MVIVVGWMMLLSNNWCLFLQFLNSTTHDLDLTDVYLTLSSIKQITRMCGGLSVLKLAGVCGLLFIVFSFTHTIEKKGNGSLITNTVLSSLCKKCCLLSCLDLTGACVCNFLKWICLGFSLSLSLSLSPFLFILSLFYVDILGAKYLTQPAVMCKSVGRVEELYFSLILFPSPSLRGVGKCIK